jgi:DeoR family transcriptional regulator, suf operon transcriptional repressor
MNRAVHPALSAMPETRQSILGALKKRGELRAEDLAETSGITASGARQHLQSLEMDGLILRREVREGVGRPKLVYKLTPAADALYPRAYSELTNELLEYVQDDDPKLLELIFKRRMQRRIDGAKLRLEPLPNLEMRVTELTRILDEDGYLADFEALPDGSYRITEHNCAIFGVAMKYGQACSSEIEFIRAVLPTATIERVAHMIAGAHVCAYAITPKVASRVRASKTTKSRGR